MDNPFRLTKPKNYTKLVMLVKTNFGGVYGYDVDFTFRPYIFICSIQDVFKEKGHL